MNRSSYCARSPPPAPLENPLVFACRVPYGKTLGLPPVERLTVRRRTRAESPWRHLAKKGWRALPKPTDRAGGRTRRSMISTTGSMPVTTRSAASTTTRAIDRPMTWLSRTTQNSGRSFSGFEHSRMLSPNAGSIWRCLLRKYAHSGNRSTHCNECRNVAQCAIAGSQAR